MRGSVIATSRKRRWPKGSVAAGGTAEVPPNVVVAYDSVTSYIVSAPHLADIQATLAVKGTATNGVLLLFACGGGSGWWTADVAVLETECIDYWVTQGYQVIQCSWLTPWLAAAEGQNAGQARLAARAAAIIKFVFDTYVDGVTDNYEVMGTSGGSAQIGYACAWYGAKKIINAALLCSGPPLTSMRKGTVPGTPEYVTPPSDDRMDQGFGWIGSLHDLGPMVAHDIDRDPGWDLHSILEGGPDLNWQGTNFRLEFLLGFGDDSEAPGLVRHLIDRLYARGIPHKERLIATTHEFQNKEPGREACRLAVLDETPHGAIQTAHAEFGGAPTTTHDLRWERPPRAGSLLVYYAWHGNTSANVTGPPGTTLAGQIDIAGTKSIGIWIKKAVGNEGNEVTGGTDARWTSSIATDASLYAEEIVGMEGAGGGYVVDKTVNVPTQNGATVINFPATAGLTASTEWGAVICGNTGSDSTWLDDSWLDDFVQGYAINVHSRILTGNKAILDNAAQDTSVTSNTAMTKSAGLLVTIKAV